MLEAVTDAIAGAAGVRQNAAGVADTDELVAAIEGGPRVSRTIPGYQESLADRTANPGLAALEYSRQSGPESGMFTQQRGTNTAAVDAAMNRSQPQATPGAFRSELETRRNERIGEATRQAQLAEQDFGRTTANLAPVMLSEGRGANIRSALEDVSDAARDMVRQAWEPLNRSDQVVDINPLAEQFGALDESMGLANRQRFRPEQADVPALLASEDPMRPFQELTGLRAAMSDEMAEASPAHGRIIQQHIDALDQFMDQSVPIGLREQYDAARAARVDFGDRFERRGDAIAETLRTTERGRRQSRPDHAVTRPFVQPNEGRRSDFDALMNEAGGDHRVRTAVSDQMLADVHPNLAAPDRLDDYLAQYSQTLDRFPELRDQLTAAADTRRAADAAQTAEQRITLEYGGPNGQRGRNVVARYLEYGDENASKAMASVMASKDPAQAIDELLTFVDDQPAAVEGARKVFWDIMQKSARSRGETTLTMSGTQPWMPQALRRFLDDPAKQAVAERLWRDNPEHLQNIRTIGEVLQGADLRLRAKAPNSSGTAQAVNPLLTPEALQSRTYAWMSGRISGTFLATSILSVISRRAVRRAQADAVHRVLNEALLDPDFAAMLLKQNNPANRAAMARSAKTWFGNEASTIIDLMSGDNEDDELVGAITARLATPADLERADEVQRLLESL